jgi:hypothetical protein
MKKIILLALSSTALLLSTASYADQSRAERAQEMKEQLTERFNAADTDHDGKLTHEEAESKMPRVAKNFDAIDVQQRDYVTVEQIESFTIQQMKKRRGRKAKADDE